MKILHIVAGELTGGAARGAYWLHLALNELDIDSKVFTNSEINLGDKSVITPLKSKKDRIFNLIRGQLDNVLTAFYPKRKRIIFSSGIFGVDFTRSKEFKEADIIHLHWINAGFVNIKHLSKIDKPIVWTIRDMWPMTGGCHYAMECEKFKTGCGLCDQLKSDRGYDLSSLVLKRKKKHYPENMKIVGISRWLSGEAKKSKLFNGFDVRTIANNIDTKEFFPIEKGTAKEILGIETAKKIILVGSTRLKDFYKGFNEYLKAIKTLDETKYFLCFFGNIETDIIDRLGFEYKSFGYLNDNISLRLAYSCAEVFVAPSLMDAFGKTLAEAMACNTPVVCFDATGPKDIVSHKIDGYKAKPFDSEDLAAGIEWILSAPNYEQLSANARNKVLREFDSRVVAKRYVELYESVLDKRV